MWFSLRYFYISLFVLSYRASYLTIPTSPNSLSAHFLLKLSKNHQWILNQVSGFSWLKKKKESLAFFPFRNWVKAKVSNLNFCAHHFKIWKMKNKSKKLRCYCKRLFMMLVQIQFSTWLVFFHLFEDLCYFHL